MVVKKRFPLLLCLTLLFSLSAWSCPAASPAVNPALAAATAQNEPASASASPSRDPRYISVRLQPAKKTLISGETGQVELVATVKSSATSGGGALNWDRRAEIPLRVWVSTPRNSGITFLDQDHPDRPHHHLLVKFARHEGDPAGVLSKQIRYTVAPRTKTGGHFFWLDVMGRLTDDQGGRIEDAGITTVPFEVDTHLSTKILMLVVVGLAVFLFIVEWVRVDVVAIAMMVLLPELGLLNAQDTFKGLSSNAVMAIIGVMIISYGLNRAGLVHKMVQPIMGFVGKGTSRLVITFSSLIAAISGVMQNTGAAVLFLPAIRSVTAYRLKVHISRVLMPIGMAAILGGTLTIIGTSPLILLNDILPPGMPKFGFLELTPIGLGLVIAGIGFLSTVGLSILGRNADKRAEAEGEDEGSVEEGLLSSYHNMTGPYEIAVPHNPMMDDSPPEVSTIRKRFLVNIVAIKRPDGTTTVAPHPSASVMPGAVLCAYGAEEDVREFTEHYGLELRERAQAFKSTLFNNAWASVVEGVVSPRSTLISKTINETRLGQTFGINVLAIHREGDTHYQDLGEQPLQSGDTLLIHGTWKQLQILQELHPNFIIITNFEHEYHKPEKAKPALFCFLGALILMIISSFWFQKLPYNPIPLSICLMAGAVGMIVTKVVSISEAYHAVDWRTVFLLSGLIPLGMAVDQTGTAQWIATGIVNGLGSLMSPLLLLAVLACMSCAFTLVISNVGACTLLVPLGISLAQQLGIDPRVAALVVGIGVSNSFMLPTHQVNALYMGPGEYITRDYIKIGGLLSLVYISVLTVMAYFFYL